MSMCIYVYVHVYRSTYVKSLTTHTKSVRLLRTDLLQYRVMWNEYTLHDNIVCFMCNCYSTGNVISVIDAYITCSFYRSSLSTNSESSVRTPIQVYKDLPWTKFGNVIMLRSHEILPYENFHLLPKFIPMEPYRSIYNLQVSEDYVYCYVRRDRAVSVRIMFLDYVLFRDL